MYGKTICDLKDLELIGGDDIVIVCTDDTESEYCGTLGITILAGTGSYILAANKRRLKTFDVDRETGQFLGTCTRIGAEELRSATVNNDEDRLTVKLKTSSWKCTYATNNKLHGHEQEDEILKLKEFFGTGFNESFTEAEAP
jgi:hypothetical protein